MKTLYPGDEGTWVKYLQLALRRAGQKIALDGIFGPKTCEALKQVTGSSVSCVVEDAQWKLLLPYLKGDVSRTSFPLVSTDVPYSSQMVEWVVEGLKARYPYLEIGEIGRSVMGRPLWYLKLGRGSIEVSYNASFHANENITTPLLLKFAENLMDAYTKQHTYLDLYAERLFQEFTLYVIPLVNPDGVDLVNGVLDDENYYRQAEKMALDFPQIPFPQGWKANIQGVDLNLQFPAGWEEAKKIKYAQGFVKPAPRDYVGVGPLSEPESIAMYNFTRRHNFSLILAYHTQGEVIYWRYLDYNPKGAYKIGQYFSSVSGYSLEETPMASAYAGYKDWFIKEFNKPGYTIEAGKGINPLSMNQFDKIYSDNVQILIGGMTELEYY